MNWSKANNVAICIFLILNIILGTMIYHRNKQMYTISTEREQAIMQVLDSYGVSVYERIPSKFLPLSKLIVVNEDVDIELLRTKVFGGAEGVRRTIESSVTILSKSEEMIRIQNGRVVYTNDRGKYPPSQWNREEATKSGERFAKELGYDFFDMKLDLVQEEAGYFILDYYEVYKGFILFDNHLQIKVGMNGVEEAKMSRYKPVGFETIKSDISSADEALFTFLREMKEQNRDRGIVIKKIDLGYALEENQTISFTGGKIVPFYRIWVVGENQYYYVNAYQNQMK